MENKIVMLPVPITANVIMPKGRKPRNVTFFRTYPFEIPEYNSQDSDCPEVVMDAKSEYESKPTQYIIHDGKIYKTDHTLDCDPYHGEQATLNEMVERGQNMLSMIDEQENGTHNYNMIMEDFMEMTRLFMTPTADSDDSKNLEAFNIDRTSYICREDTQFRTYISDNAEHMLKMFKDYYRRFISIDGNIFVNDNHMPSLTVNETWGDDSITIDERTVLTRNMSITELILPITYVSDYPENSMKDFISYINVYKPEEIDLLTKNNCRYDIYSLAQLIERTLIPHEEIDIKKMNDDEISSFMDLRHKMKKLNTPDENTMDDIHDVMDTFQKYIAVSGQHNFKLTSTFKRISKCIEKIESHEIDMHPYHMERDNDGNTVISKYDMKHDDGFHMSP